MLKIQNLDKSYGSQVLFDEASFQMNPGERIGLVGRNGYGKSTLFKLILGEEEPNSGTISVPKNYRIGHLAQYLKFTENTVVEEACLGLPPGEEHEQYKAERILSGLGFTEDDMYMPPESFSGGFQIRLNLAKVLVSNPNLLLLDEPTNYLDIVSIRWITDFLRRWKNEMILISHDREFMDAVCTHTALIHRCNIRKVEGGTEKLYSLVELAEETHEKTRQNEEKKRAQAEQFINRFRAQAGRAAMVQSRIKQLEKKPQLEELSTIKNLDFNFRHEPTTAKILLEAENLSFGYDPDQKLFSNLNLNIGFRDRIAIIGKNGKGKSTLLNVLAGELTPLTGSIKTHSQMQLGYFGQTNIVRLDPKLTVEEEITCSNTQLGRTAVRSICGLMMFSGDHAEKKISSLSGGEKSRVMLGKILAKPSNLLFLDEPTNHLDMQSIEALVESIQDFPGASVTVTHSEDILRKIANRLVIFLNDEVHVFNGTYDEFLEKIGWEEENGKMSGHRKSNTKPPHPLSPSRADNLKANEASDKKENRAALEKMKREIADLEKVVLQAERTIDASNSALVKASQSQDREAFVTHSRILKESQKTIDEAFVQMEKLEQKLKA